MSETLGDRQAAAGRQGSAFEATVEVLLQVEGWSIEERKWRHDDLDIEVDLVAMSPDGERWWIECKGSWESNRNGLERTDTMKKAIANGALLKLAVDRRRYMVIASHPPKERSAGFRWLQLAVSAGYIDRLRVVSLTTLDPSEATS